MAFTKLQEEERKKNEVKKTPTVSDEDRDEFNLIFGILKKKFEKLNENNLQNNDEENISFIKESDQIIENCKELLTKIITTTNKDKNGFAIMYVLEGFAEILTTIASTSRYECGYKYPENRPDKIYYVNQKLFEKMMEMCENEGYTF